MPDIPRPHGHNSITPWGCGARTRQLVLPPQDSLVGRAVQTNIMDDRDSLYADATAAAATPWLYK